LLIQRGANVNSCSVITKKRTPLHLAIISEAPIEKRINIIRQLVAAKADAQLKDEYGYSSLEAILNHADNYWSHLSAELSAMLKPNMELEPLSFAQCIHDKNLIMMKKILDCSNDFPLKSKGAYGRSLLYAVHYSTPEIVCELLSRSPKLPGLKSSSKLFLSIIENSEFSPLKKAILVYLINRKLSKREYETSLTFCGYTLFTSFRFSRTEKLSAAEALRAVIFNHEEESVLQGHVGALNSGRLSMVYRMYLKEKAEQQKALEMRM
jgi:ankyrin repeat protein